MRFTYKSVVYCHKMYISALFLFSHYVLPKIIFTQTWLTKISNQITSHFTSEFTGDNFKVLHIFQEFLTQNLILCFFYVKAITSDVHHHWKHNQTQVSGFIISTSSIFSANLNLSTRSPQNHYAGKFYSSIPSWCSNSNVFCKFLCPNLPIQTKFGFQLLSPFLVSMTFCWEISFPEIWLQNVWPSWMIYYMHTTLKDIKSSSSS